MQVLRSITADVLFSTYSLHKQKCCIFSQNIILKHFAYAYNVGDISVSTQMRCGYALQNSQKYVSCNGLQHLCCFQLFLNINTYAISHITIRFLSVLQLIIGFVFIAPFIQDQPKCSNFSNDGSKYVFRIRLEHLYCFQHFLNINTNALSPDGRYAVSHCGSN